MLTASSVQAQGGNATVSGTVTDSSGRAMASANVSVRNVGTGQSTDTLSDASGVYRVSNLPAGEYEVSASADETAANVAKVTLAAASHQMVNLSLIPKPTAAAAANQSAGTSSENLPNAPSSSQTAPSLSDLGFSPAELQANAKQQALLDKRRSEERRVGKEGR